MPEEDNQAAFELIGQLEQMTYNDIPERACVVIEEGWPDYATTWSMIEARVTGRPTSDSFSVEQMAV